MRVGISVVYIVVLVVNKMRSPIVFKSERQKIMSIWNDFTRSRMLVIRSSGTDFIEERTRKRNEG